MITADDPFLGVCRVSREGFIAALDSRACNAGLIAEREPDAYWEECRAWGLDPCFLLAMFLHESSFGTAGTAMETKSWGNTRSPSFGAAPIDEVAGRSGVFPAFASWFDGAASTAGRLASPVWPQGAPYGERVSIREVFDHESGQVWAPAGDLNDPAGYLNAMLAAMNEFCDQGDEPITAVRPPAPPVYSRYLTVNYNTGRQTHRPLAVVLHITQGDDAEGCLNWFSNPASQVSAHYVIDRDGAIFAAVREQDTAWANGVMNRPNTDIAVVARWAAGTINPNSESIAIECAGYSSQQPAGQPPELVGYTEAQFQSLAFLLPAIAGRWDLVLDGEDCFGHREIDGVNREDCPGLSDAEWERIYRSGLVYPVGPFPTADAAYDAYCRENGETVVWAGQIVGRGHWLGRDPQELCRTDASALLGYDGGYARDLTAQALDDWETQTKAAGQLTIWGEPPPAPVVPEPGPVGAAWPVHPGDGLADLPGTITFVWGKDAPTADLELYREDGVRVFALNATPATEVDVLLPGPGAYEWAVRGRDGERTSDWSLATFSVAEPEPEEPDPPDKPPSTAPYPPVVTPTFAEQPTAPVWRNVSDGKVDLAVSRRWRPDCDGGTGPWPDTDQWVNPDFPNEEMTVAPLEIRALTRRLSIHPPIVEAGWRQALWDRVPVTYDVEHSEWADEACQDYGDDWDDMPPHAQNWAGQICTLATAIQHHPTLADALRSLGLGAAEADAWAWSYHCLRRRVRDLAELTTC